MNTISPLALFTIVILAILLLWVSFAYMRNTTQHFSHAAEGMGKMLLVLLVVVLILGLLAYSWAKF